MDEADRKQYPEVDEILKVIEKLNEIAKGDFVIYRSGSLDEGEFRVGRNTRVPFYGARKYQLHRYGVPDDFFGNKMSVEDRLRTTLDSPYSARHVSDTEGLVYLHKPNEKLQKDLIRVDKNDLMTWGFQLTDERRLPRKVQNYIERMALGSIYIYQEMIARAFPTFCRWNNHEGSIQQNNPIEMMRPIRIKIIAYINGKIALKREEPRQFGLLSTKVTDR